MKVKKDYLALPGKSYGHLWRTIMVSRQNVKVLVLVGDKGISRSVEALLKRRSYDVTVFLQKKEALDFLKEKSPQLAVVGDTEKNVSPFESMKDIVMTSPMTSIILITDLPKKEVDEKAEGYGILGHINRKIPPDDLASLLENFEKVFRSLARPKI
jgi:DNA-binding NtrC family response regulator